MKGADQIIDRILWDEKLQKIKNDISVVYDDRFMGPIEKPVIDFMNSEAKSYRIL